MKRLRNCFLPAIVLTLSSACLNYSIAYVKHDRKITVNVTVISDRLPLEKKSRMSDFAAKVQNYLNNRSWISEDFVNTFEISFQFFLEDNSSQVEDIYKCSMIAAGPDIQYYDKRSIFPFQQGEIIQESDQYVPVRGLIDYYMYMIIANELDKYGAFSGNDYFAKAVGVIKEGKNSSFAYGWDVREDQFNSLSSENYQLFRKMKDQYFYALWSTNEPGQTQQYMLEALKSLEKVLVQDKENIAAKNFLDAHYQEMIDVFRNGNDNMLFEILMRIDPDRRQTYEQFIRSN